MRQINNINEWVAVNKVTKEERAMSDFMSIDNSGGFNKAFLGVFSESIFFPGNGPISFLSFSLKNKDNKNLVTCKQDDIARGCGVNVRTVSRTIKAFEEKKFIRRIEPWRFMINPNIICYGGSYNQRLLLNKWEELK